MNRTIIYISLDVDDIRNIKLARESLEEANQKLANSIIENVLDSP